MICVGVLCVRVVAEDAILTLVSRSGPFCFSFSFFFFLFFFFFLSVLFVFVFVFVFACD